MGEWDGDLLASLDKRGSISVKSNLNCSAFVNLTAGLLLVICLLWFACVWRSIKDRVNRSLDVLITNNGIEVVRLFDLPLTPPIITIYNLQIYRSLQQGINNYIINSDWPCLSDCPLQSVILFQTSNTSFSSPKVWVRHQSDVTSAALCQCVTHRRHPYIQRDK